MAVQPDPGAASFCDVLCIPSEAPSRDLAVAVIDFMLTPEPQAQLVNALNWATVTPAAVDLIKPELRSLFDYNDLDSVFARSPMFGYPPRSANDRRGGDLSRLDRCLGSDQDGEEVAGVSFSCLRGGSNVSGE